jgi:hypothetical protein
MKKILISIGLVAISAIAFCQEVVAKDSDPAFLKWLDKLYFIGYILIAGALYSYYRGYKQSKSGSLESYNNGATRESNENIPFYKCPATIYGYILTLAAIGFYIWKYLEK